MPYVQFEKIQIGPVTIYVWGLFLVLGLLFVLFYSLKRSKSLGTDPNLIIDASLWLLIGMIIGARLGYVLEYLNYYFLNPIEILKVWQGGLTFHGGLIGLLTAGIIFARVKKISLETFFKTADIIALSAPLGIAIARIGCSLINDHQGVQTLLPWAIIWPDGVMRHPVAEYLILANIAIFLILYFSKPQKTGQTFFFFLFLYSVMRFFLDFTRSADPLYFSLSTAQWLSLSIILGIIIKKLIKRSFYPAPS
ncbi:hypothetical protein AMJ47_01095 [Parcubacteria bacterium DG_72]|nr:MAG: hypothetical protein AMJ47_01095 [Parcubacteria bacterium DG_72]